MSDAGYTLTETLAALTILALAVGGLAAGVQVLSQNQLGVSAELNQVRAMRDAQMRLNDLLDGQGPFGAHQPDRFTGSAERLEFDCGESIPCRADLVQQPGKPALKISAHGAVALYPLVNATAPRFVYRGAQGASASWPPASLERQALRAVAVIDGAGSAISPLLQARVWREQPVACEFDVILQDCR